MGFSLDVLSPAVRVMFIPCDMGFSIGYTRFIPYDMGLSNLKSKAKRLYLLIPCDMGFSTMGYFKSNLNGLIPCAMAFSQEVE